MWKEHELNPKTSDESSIDWYVLDTFFLFINTAYAVLLHLIETSNASGPAACNWHRKIGLSFNTVCFLEVMCSSHRPP